MRAPILDLRITIQKPQTVRAADGQESVAWVDFATVSGGRRDIPASRRGEAFAGDQFNDVVFTEWTIRDLRGLTGNERVLDEDGRPGDLFGLPASLGGRREYLILTVQRGMSKQV